MHLLSTLSGVAGVALHVGGWSARVLRRCCHKMHVTELLCPLGRPDGLHCLVLGTLCNNRDFLPTSMRLVKLPSLYDRHHVQVGSYTSQYELVSYMHVP